MGMTRSADWPSRLNAAIDAARGRPFEWGVHDCTLWAADVVLSMTGVDPAVKYRGRYSTGGGAAKALEDEGLSAVEDAAAEALGQPCPPTAARRGDIVLVTQKGRRMLAVCTGRHACLPTSTGLGWVDMDSAICAWRVG